jgi:hypothetical protein
MKNINPLGLFDEHFLLERLTKLKDPLVKLEKHIDWNIFAPILDVVFSKPENSSNAGRPPFDRVLMFKILILQSLYNLSDDAMEYQITDRRSFTRFLGLKISDRVPDSKTIWKFRETLIHEEVIEALFYRFNQALDDQCIFANTGQSRPCRETALLKFHSNETRGTKTKRSRPVKSLKPGNRSPTSFVRKIVMPGGCRNTKPTSTGIKTI